MIKTLEDLSNLLRGSCLEDKEISQLEINDSEQYAFAVEINYEELFESWEFVRSHKEQIEYYPVVTHDWGDRDFFNRFYYEEEKHEGKLQSVSSEAIIAAYRDPNLERFLQDRKASTIQYLDESFIELSLEQTKERFGNCPTFEAIKVLMDARNIRSTIDLEKWLFEWELQNVDFQEAIQPVYTSYLDWFEPDRQVTLILLPIKNSWDSLAYIHWYGACSIGTTTAIAFLKKWYQQYAAELICHYGTMLQFQVGRKPATPEEAFQLAWEQEAIAECTTILPGVSLRDHARSLLSLDRWFLHERP